MWLSHRYKADPSAFAPCIAEARSALQRLAPDQRPDGYRAQFARLVALEQHRRTVSGENN